MTNTADGAPSQTDGIAANTTNTQKDFTVKPLSTMRGDLAELLTSNSLSPQEINTIKRELQEEARAYHEQGGDERYLATMFPPKRESLDIHLENLATATKKPDDDADLFIQKTTAEIIAEQIPKSRQKTEEMKQSLVQNSADAVQRSSVTVHEVAHPGPAPIIISPTPPTAPPPPQTAPTPQKAPEPIPVPPASPVRPPEPPVDPLIAEEKELSKLFATLPEKERALSDAGKKLADERGRFEALLAPLKDEEHALEEKENSLHIEEARAENGPARRRIEEERWQIEDRRRAVEQKRWRIDQEIIRIQNDTNRLEDEKKRLSAERVTLEERKMFIEKKRRAQKAQEEFKALEKSLSAFAAEKEPLEIAWIELSEKRKASLTELDRIRAREQVLEGAIVEADVAERKTLSPEERHEFESRRWKGEEERRTLEKKRWTLEDGVAALEISMKELKEKYQKIITRENVVKKQMEELQKLVEEVRHSS